MSVYIWSNICKYTVIDVSWYISQITRMIHVKRHQDLAAKGNALYMHDSVVCIIGHVRIAYAISSRRFYTWHACNIKPSTKPPWSKIVTHKQSGGNKLQCVEDFHVQNQCWYPLTYYKINSCIWASIAAQIPILLHEPMAKY